MTALLRIFLIAGLATLNAAAGNITGKVHAEGKPGTGPGAGGGRYESHEFSHLEQVDYQSMRDFVVWIVGPIEGYKPAAGGGTAVVNTTNTMAQHHATFEPHILPILAGTSVEFPNNDDIYHNVFSYSEVKSFDLGLYKGLGKPVLFDKPGEVDVFCSIHSSMSCVILVMDNPYFAKTVARGAYTISNVPAGTYKLKAWHERMPPQIKTDIVVPETGEVKVDFTITIGGPPR